MVRILHSWHTQLEHAGSLKAHGSGGLLLLAINVSANVETMESAFKQ